jgi:hypothetical protein
MDLHDFGLSHAQRNSMTPDLCHSTLRPSDFFLCQSLGIPYEHIVDTLLPRKTALALLDVYVVMLDFLNRSSRRSLVELLDEVLGRYEYDVEYKTSTIMLVAGKGCMIIPSTVGPPQEY